MDGWEEPGLALDSLWVAGLTATAWPRPVRIDPFLPIEAQRRFRMPRATAEGCLAECEAILAAWRAQSGALVRSWPQREDDTDADVSALVPRELPALPVPGACPDHPYCGGMEILIHDLGSVPDAQLSLDSGVWVLSGRFAVQSVIASNGGVMSISLRAVPVA